MTRTTDGVAVRGGSLGLEATRSVGTTALARLIEQLVGKQQRIHAMRDT